jgi:hypothetical protein
LESIVEGYTKESRVVESVECVELEPIKSVYVKQEEISEIINSEDSVGNELRIEGIT